MAYRTIWETNGILWEFSGTVSFEEVSSATSEMYNSFRFDDLKYFIWDGTNIDAFDLSYHHIEIRAAIANASSSYKRDLKGVFISNSQIVRERLTYYIQKSRELNSTWDFKLFSTVEEARIWLSSHHVSVLVA